MSEPQFDSSESLHHDQREIEARDKAMDAAKELLRGMFDGLVILGSFTLEDGGTYTMDRRDGNTHAVSGMLDYALCRSRGMLRRDYQDGEEA